MSWKYTTDYRRVNNEWVRTNVSRPWLPCGYVQDVYIDEGATKPGTKCEWTQVNGKAKWAEVPCMVPVPRLMSDDEVMRADMTKPGEATMRAKQEQGSLLKLAGYDGPLPQGSGRALSVLVREHPEFSDCLRRGWIPVKVESIYYERWIFTGPCYVFKSPVPDLTAEQFLRLCRMLKKSSKRLADQIGHLLTHPEALEEAKGLLVMDNLAEGFGV